MSCSVQFEKLVAYADGDLSPEVQAQVAEHLEECTECRDRMRMLEKTEASLHGLEHEMPCTEALLRIRHALSRELRGAPGPEIMTLEEVAKYLRVPVEQLEEVAGDLPAFEFAGTVRVRRGKLEEWIEQREHEHARSSVESWVSRSLSEPRKEGVA